MKSNNIDKLRKYIREQVYSILNESDNSKIYVSEKQKEISPEERERKAQAAKEQAEKVAYQRFFSQALAKFGVSTVNSLPDDKKQEFFNYVDANWKSKEESSPKESINKPLSEISQRITVNGKTYDSNVFFDDKSANAFMEENPGWGVIKVDGADSGNPKYNKSYRVYVAKNDDVGKNVSDGEWTDPAGGIHSDDEEDPAKMYETSATGGVAGYETPGAFTGKKGISKKQRSIANQLGYELVDKSYANKGEGNPEDLTDENKLTEGMDSFYFKDENLTAEQKLGLAMRQVRNSLYEVEKVVTRTIKMKNEENVDSSKIGKRTFGALRRINEKVIRLMIALQDLK